MKSTDRFRQAQVLCIFVLLFAISGCASTGVIPMGKDTYTISKQSATGFESAVGVRGAILKEANEFCQKQGLVMVVVSINTKDGVPGRSYATAELVFRAVKPDDAENVRPNLQKQPDAVLEVRNK